MSKPKNLETEEKLNNLTTYSTEETKTGEKWVDRKDIYRKVFNIEITSQEVDIDLSDLNIEEAFINHNRTYLKIEKIGETTVNRNTSLILTNISTQTPPSGKTEYARTLNQCGYYFNNNFTTLKIEVGKNIKANSAIITIEYTKK